ncbi:hypothetical protein AX15_006526 [Amanita polypyramis BW_CC]|nr:hypothetical protein AX15_006526 [Amanita polypyramis BW_CC]
MSSTTTGFFPGARRVTLSEGSVFNVRGSSVHVVHGNYNIVHSKTHEDGGIEWPVKTPPKVAEDGEEATTLEVAADNEEETFPEVHGELLSNNCRDHERGGTLSNVHGTRGRALETLSEVNGSYIVITIPQDRAAAVNAMHVSDASTGPDSEGPEWLTFSLSRNFLLTALTLKIPSFHESLTSRESGLDCLGLKASIAAWKAVRFFDGLLIAAMTTIFKPSVQASVTFWLFISCSLVQAIVGLICSTILIIYFSSSPDVCILIFQHVLSG